jgi:gluconate 2-dehydrogenase
MKPKVLALRKLPEEARAIISDQCELREVEDGESLARENLEALIGDVHGLLQSGLQIDDELLDKAPMLKVVSNVSVGYNNFDLEAMRRRGIIGTHTPYVLDDTVADLAIALMLAAARRIPELDRKVKEGRWSKDEPASADFGMDVHHATLGIVGLGRIGEAVAKRAALGFDMNILYYNRRRKQEVEERYGAKYRTLEQLLQESDFVVVLAPLTNETKRMFRREQFQLMKPSAIFINVSRGQLVDEEALVEALELGWIRAAGLDVYAEEPVSPSHPLLRLPQVVTLPHIGSATARTRHKMHESAARSLVAALTGHGEAHIVPELRS